MIPPFTRLSLVLFGFLSSKSPVSSTRILQSMHTKPALLGDPEPFRGTPDAHQLFDEMPDRNYRTYNALIRSYTSSNQHWESLALFRRMHGVGLRPDSFAFAAVVKSSAVLLFEVPGRSFHGFAVKAGYAVIVAVAKAVVDMYARFGSVHDAHRVFSEMGCRDSVSWNVLMSGYARAELYMQVMNLFNLMRRCDDGDVKPTAITIAICLPVCAKVMALKAGKSIHGFAIKAGLESETLAGNALLSMYAKCGCVISDAKNVFDLLLWKDVISWNSMIAGYSENGFFAEACETFKKMALMSVVPNDATIANVLPICSFVENSCCYGREIHGYVLRFGLEKYFSVCNALLTHYSKVGDMHMAESVFKKMNVKDLVSWNTMIAGCATNGCLSRALELFHELLLTGIKPDSITFITVLPVCAQSGDRIEGKKIHDYILQHPRLWLETSIRNALISFYGKCGEPEEALQIFIGMTNRDLVSWNAMLTVYANNEQWRKVIDLSDQMFHEGIQPDSVTILSVLQACAFLGIGKIREAHGYSLRTGFISKLSVGNAILDAYAKCGNIESALRTFTSLTEKNVVTGNAMISGYLKHGCLDNAETIFNKMCQRDLTSWNLMVQVYAQNDCMDQAFDLFNELQAKGMRPDAVSIVSILSACARMASVQPVRQCHAYKIRVSFDDLLLEGALLDTYSKCGSINDAYKLFQTSSQKDLVTLTAMISGYAMHGMAEEAFAVFSSMLELDIKPDHVVFTALLSACSHAGKIDEGQKLFKSIQETHGIKPTMEHYSCMVDLLARGGSVRQAYDFVINMPCEPNASVWGTLLGACKTHSEVEIGQLVADRLFYIEAQNIGNYVVMSNIYAAGRRWDGVEQVRKLMKSKDLRKPAGCSWIEFEGKRHVFIAADLSHSQRRSIYLMLATLDQQIREKFYRRR